MTWAELKWGRGRTVRNLGFHSRHQVGWQVGGKLPGWC